MPNSAGNFRSGIGKSSQWQSKSNHDFDSNQGLKYSSSLRSQELADMLNFLSIMGIALTPSQVRRINEMRRRGLSGEKITTPSDEKFTYQLPSDQSSGRWVRESKSQNQQVNYFTSPDQFSISLKRTFVGLVLRISPTISPIIAKYLSQNSIDVFAIQASLSEKKIWR